MNRIQEKYNQEVIKKMRDKFGYRNDLAVPRIKKATLNIGVGRFKQDQKIVEEIENTLAAIAGQKPVYTQAKKAIASFKTRVGMPIGLKVTLRGPKMYAFVDRLTNLALPRTRDFRGLESKSVDKNGNLSIGIKEQIVFPEISHENIKTIFGLEITLTVNAGSKEEGLELFRLMGFPMKKS